MITNCPWCNLLYNLTPETEAAHLKICSVLNELPVAETRDGKNFVALSDCPSILVERPTR